jgi:hypothetical protein
MQKKYIVVEEMFGEHIIIFPPGLYHKAVAGNMKVISAGFMDIQYDVVPEMPYGIKHIHCYGESESLKIGSRPYEDKILASILLKGD